MGSPNIRDVLTSFSPSLDFFAVTSGDGRIKIWDTLKGQLQTEFSNILSSDGTDMFTKPEERGHLSIDYKCMKWVGLGKKKKRKLVASLLVLGTGSGDVLALDVSAGQLKWKISDCHPGGVTAISFSSQGSCIYTSGADGMVCEVDFTGNLLRKFKASRKAVSTMSVSSDGRFIATAAAEMKIFSCSDHKKIQKFSGHPGAVRCMALSENGKYVFSSAVDDRYVVVWRVDGSKNRSSSCLLAMEHPAVYVDCRCIDSDETDGAEFYVLAISEVGVCYFWYGKDIIELKNARPTKISFSGDDKHLKFNKATAAAAIFAAKMQNIAMSASATVFLAHGFMVKPAFERIVVHHGEDLKLATSNDGLVLKMIQPHKSVKQLSRQTGATALDRSNAEGALLPVPRVLDHDRINQVQSIPPNFAQAETTGTRDGIDVSGADSNACPMEDRLKSLGLISTMDSAFAKSMRESIFLKDINLEMVIPPKKLRAAVLSMSSSDAYKTLSTLIDLYRSRSYSGKYVLPWIYSILVHHGHQIMSQEPENGTVYSLYKIAKSKGSAIHSLSQLSGRLQLVTAQIDKAAQLKSLPQRPNDTMIDSEDEDDDDVDEVLYGDESETSDEN